MAGVLDDQPDTSVPSKVDGGLDVCHGADVHHIDGVSALRLSGRLIGV